MRVRRQSRTHENCRTWNAEIATIQSWPEASISTRSHKVRIMLCAGQSMALETQWHTNIAIKSVEGQLRLALHAKRHTLEDHHAGSHVASCCYIQEALSTDTAAKESRPAVHATELAIPHREASALFTGFDYLEEEKPMLGRRAASVGKVEEDRDPRA
jgi:hypothetical protein